MFKQDAYARGITFLQYEEIGTLFRKHSKELRGEWIKLSDVKLMSKKRATHYINNLKAKIKEAQDDRFR